MTGPTSKYRYALTGLIYCGTCGRRMLGQAPYGKHKYVCSQYIEGRKVCDRFEVKEPEALRMILEVLRTEVFDKHFQPADIEAIKTEMRRMLNAGDQSVSVKVNKQQLAKVELKIKQAQKRLLDMDSDMVKHVTTGIRELADQRDDLRRRLAGSEDRPSKQVEAVEERIQAAIGWLNDLESMVDTDFDPVKVNQMLGQFVSQVEFNVERVAYGPSKVKSKCVIVGGVIQMKADTFPLVLSVL